MASQGDIQGIKEMQRMLAGLDTKLVSALQKEAKTIAAPGAERVRSAIPSVVPLTGKNGFSGMLNHGRLGWGVGKPANSVSVRYRTSRSKKAAVTSLVAIWVNSPGTAMIDTAGKGKHTKRTKQGIAMIRKLTRDGANNFAWPAVEQEIPRMNAEIRLVLNKYAAIVNREVSR
jgi:hypothetical protein